MYGIRYVQSMGILPEGRAIALRFGMRHAKKMSQTERRVQRRCGRLFSRHSFGKDLALNDFMRRFALHHALPSKFLTALGAGAVAGRVVFYNALD